MACALVWRLDATLRQQQVRFARLLVQLSGRQLNYRRRHTTPALLAGLWVLLAMLEVLQQHRVEDLRGFKKLLLDVVEEDSG